MRLGLRELAAVWAIHRTAGAEPLILVDLVESSRDQEGYRDVIPVARIAVCRLVAALPTIERRLAGHETGGSLAWHTRRAGELARLMDERRVGERTVDTDRRSGAEVATEVLARSSLATVSRADVQSDVDGEQ